MINIIDNFKKEIKNFNNSALIIVDMQNDFYKGGSLPIIKNDTIINNINELIMLFKTNNQLIIFTKDNHGTNHISFNEWKPHCIKNTKGNEIISKINFNKDNDLVICKGEEDNIENYSAFYNGKKLNKLNDELQSNKIENVYIVGVAAEYCVKHTAFDSVNFGYNTYLIRQGILAADENINLNDIANKTYDNHISVQKDKSIDYLNVKENGIYFDCTFGRGGHSLEILKRLNNTGLLISIDKDKDAQKYYEDHFEKFNNHKFVKDTFSNLEKIIKDLNIKEIDGFIFDFGVSSPMLDNPTRGFSYKQDARLDMRMDQTKAFDAYQLINSYSYEQLNNIFKKYGEINNPSYVSKAIVKYRNTKPIETTMELVDIIRNSVHKKELYKKKHFSRVYFQAIRMEVNNELNEIHLGIETAMKYLADKGRIVTISFHSLEEKEVKKILNKFKNDIYPKELPINNLKNQYRILNIKNKWADKQELNINNRSRSSLLKVIEREL